LHNIVDADVRDEDTADATLANISTLKSELGGTLLAASHLLESPDSEDANDTLKDADHINLELDWEKGSLVGDVPLQSDAQLGTNLLSAIDKYNSLSPTGQETVFDSDNDVCRGFIRVAMDLRRPIHVVSGSQPPCVFTVTDESGSLNSLRDGERTLTSFYLPPDTVKALHVTSRTTTRDVIRSLLSKFHVADNPHKYVLYEKTLLETGAAGGCDPLSLGRVRQRRLRDEERPLLLALRWCLHDHEAAVNKRFVLQENDPGDVAWESFSLPELRNFLLILDREEAWYKKRIHDRYESTRAVMQQMLEEKK
jgi:Ras association domain-containing protein 1